MVTPAEPNQLWSFLNSIPNVVIWQAKDLQDVTYISDGVANLLGLEPHTVVNNPNLWAGRIYRRHRRRYEHTLSLLREVGAPSDIEYRATLPDARAVWLRDHLTYDPETELIYGVTTRIDDQRDNEERLGFLNKAGKILGSSLDTRELLHRLAGLIVGSLADVCIIEVQEGDDVIVVARARNNRALSRSLEQAGPLYLSRKRIPSRLKEGRPVLYPKLTRRQLTAITGVQGARLLTNTNSHAAIVAPLTIRARMLGVVTFLCADPEKEYIAKDVELATEVCRQAATALDHARLYRQADEARQNLARENEMKDEFLGIMSHELRTPLTVIYGVSRVLPRLLPDLDDDGRGLVDDLYSASERTVRLVEDLMLLARLNLGETPELENIDVDSLLKDVSQDFVKQYAGRPLATDGAESGKVRGAPAFLRQVLLNLLSNAHKYSPAGEPVRIGAYTQDGECVLYVQDSGQGLPEQELASVFDRFYRSANSHGVSGAGLGLAICKRLCEAQGGRIWADNAQEGGLRVSLALPSH